MHLPHLQRHRRSGGWQAQPQSWTAVQYVFGSIAILAVPLALMFPEQSVLAVVALSVLPLGLGFIVPLVAVRLAVAQIVRDKKSRLYDHLLLTPLSNQQVVWGYVGGALWRVRLALAVLATMWGMGMAVLFIAGPLRLDFEPTYAAMTLPGLFVMSVVALQWVGICLLVLMLAVAVGLRLQSAFGINLTVSMLTPVTILLGYILMFVTFLLVFVSDWTDEPGGPVVKALPLTKDVLAAILITVGLPYVILAGVQWLAARWSRRPLDP